MNNKLTPNTTQIPNILLDEWMSELSATEFKIVMIIARQTYGWHKDSDAISYSQLKFKTGASNGSIGSSLKSLREKGLIQVLDENDKILTSKEECRGKVLYYRINVTSPKTGDDLSKNRTPKIGDTKETNTKTLTLSTKEIKESKDLVPRYGNEFVNRILEDFTNLTGLERPTDGSDRQIRQYAWNFHRKYGSDIFKPAFKYLQELWPKVEITSIRTVSKNMPIYQRDVLKIRSVKLTKEQEDVLEMLKLGATP